jgi:hypothetical protein
LLINAKWIEKLIQVELPYDSSDMHYLEAFLRKSGFTFNEKIKKFECEYDGREPFKVYWQMSHTIRMTVLNSFIGRIIPPEDSIRQIVYPVKPKVSYILEMDSRNLDCVIRTLFDHDFEIIGISQGGQNQLYKMRENQVLVHQSKLDSSLRVTFKGADTVSRPLLSSFSIS